MDEGMAKKDTYLVPPDAERETQYWNIFINEIVSVEPQQEGKQVTRSFPYLWELFRGTYSKRALKRPSERMILDISSKGHLKCSRTPTTNDSETKITAEI